MADQLERLKDALSERYRIEREVGSGGMATVYLAEDLKHKRKVALKVLRPELAAVLGAERFVQEIRTTANLQHPHILPLFDSGEADSFLYYVMPFIEGETLRDKLNRETQLGIEEAVKITTEVADALDYAHRQNVIHRDIKPENILLHDGRPMVADFGIALAVSAAAGGRMTETGLSLGTPHYMSPEQATAEKNVTNRSDIYSLGCVLYEMLTGTPPHLGGSAQQIIMKIVTDTPRPVTELRKSVPPNVAAATAKSLEKLPADRFESAATFAAALGNPDFVDHGVTAATRYPHASTRIRTVGVLGWVSAVILAAVLAWMASRPTPARDQSLAHLNINLDESAPMVFVGAASLGIGRPAIAMSRDGKLVVYVGLQDDIERLFVRPLDAYEARAVPGTEGAYGPFFSPNGRFVGFFVGNELKKVAVDGGDPIVLATVANPMGADWGSDDRIVFAGREGDELLRVSADGGPVERLFQIRPGSEVTGYAWPSLSPDGRFVLVSGYPESSFVIDLAGGNATLLRTPAAAPRFVGSRHVLYLSGSVLFASAFDANRAELVGQSVPVLTGLRTEVYGVGHWAVSEDGDIVYAPGQAVAEGQLAWLVDGALEPLKFTSRRHGTFELSPDGRRLAIEVWSSVLEIWVYEFSTGREQKLSTSGNSRQPNWSPDGESIIFESDREGAFREYVQGVDAGSEPERFAIVPDDGFLSGWSGDARYLAVVQMDSQSSAIAVVDTASGELQTVHESDGTNWGAVMSPDGRAIAYTSDETGAYHVYVTPFPPSRLRRQVSREGGAEEPVWAPDGTKLYFRSGQRLMASSVRTDPDLTVGNPAVVFERDWVNVGGRSYAVAPDGQRFLIIDGGAGTTITLNVIRGWMSEVQRSVDEIGR